MPNSAGVESSFLAEQSVKALRAGPKKFRSAAHSQKKSHHNCGCISKAKPMHTPFRNPTRQMIEKLRYCYEQEQLAKKPCLAEDMKSSLPGLYKRGLVETSMEFINHKRILCIHITKAGKEFLESVQDRSQA